MAPRPRKKGNKDLPVNLYPKRVKGVTYYQWRDPRDKKYHGMGTEKTEAIASANRLNTSVYKAKRSIKISRIAKKRGVIMRDWLRRYWTIITTDRNLADNTLRTRANIVEKIRKELGKFPVDEITVEQCADFINSYRKQGKNRMAQSIRSVLIDVFRDAMAEGITNNNPALITRNPQVEVKRSRLTLEEYGIIFQAAADYDPWVQNSMLLAMTTGQRREDIAMMKFKDIKDGFLHIKQNKTGTLLRLNLNIKLNVIGVSIGDVVKRCKDIVCPTLLHHTKNTNLSKIGNPIHIDTVTRLFTEVRRGTNLQWDHPPTFHELRSLAAREYVKQGVDVQLLLGHKDPRMTDVYKDNRGAEWIEVNG